MKTLKAPFPYFGGKSKVASMVWQRLGDVRNYIEPFCGSAAVLLARPTEPKVETLNDVDDYIANFWRAVTWARDEVVEYVDWPVNEDDLHARHRWLVSPDARERLGEVSIDPSFYDAKIAGWWAWGLCCWIGSGWCSHDGKRLDGDVQQRVPEGHVARGVHKKRPAIGDKPNGSGVNQIPDLSGDSGAAGRGVHSISRRIQLSGHGVGKGVHAEGRPQLADKYSRGRGVHGNDAAGTCEQRRAWLLEWFGRLQDRLRAVRVCCGDWQRVCKSDSVTTRIGLTGIFLDPPYPIQTKKGTRSGDIYATDRAGNKSPDQIRDEVLAYCLDRGKNPMYRIAVCGYEGDGYEVLRVDGWQVEHWKANGGYGNRSDQGQTNKHRERIWFSPHCLRGGLFD